MNNDHQDSRGFPPPTTINELRRQPSSSITGNNLPDFPTPRLLHTPSPMSLEVETKTQNHQFHPLSAAYSLPLRQLLSTLQHRQPPPPPLPWIPTAHFTKLQQTPIHLPIKIRHQSSQHHPKSRSHQQETSYSATHTSIQSKLILNNIRKTRRRHRRQEFPPPQNQELRHQCLPIVIKSANQRFLYNFFNYSFLFL